MEPLRNLSAALGVAAWAKRDDLTGLALGGNKVRELEYHLGEALAIGADTIITTGNSQSNHARTTAAACARLGLDCRLVLEPGLKPQNGNLLLDHLFGARAELLPGYTPASAVEAMEALAADLRHAGRTPHIIPFGGCSTTGAIGFVGGALELCRQIDDQGLDLNAVYLATASCGTQAGLLAGMAAAGKTVRVRGISVSDPREIQETQVRELAGQTLDRLGLDLTVGEDAADVDDAYIGDGYGLLTEGSREAVRLVALTEGILLDPVYTGKAMAGLIDHVRTGLIPQGSTVVFIHTGGVPALFAYGSEALTAARPI
jgi:L-cysteate sulfo-lyase